MCERLNRPNYQDALHSLHTQPFVNRCVFLRYFICSEHMHGEFNFCVRNKVTLHRWLVHLDYFVLGRNSVIGLNISLYTVKPKMINLLYEIKENPSLSKEMTTNNHTASKRSKT